MTDVELYEMAVEAADGAYAPYSGYRVGAALLTVDGEIYTGANVENSSYGATICAERTAAVKAVTDGKREFAALAVARQGAADRPGLAVCAGSFCLSSAGSCASSRGRTRDGLRQLRLTGCLRTGSGLKNAKTRGTLQTSRFSHF